MKGDFSRFELDPREDHQGVLMQQGRVVTDADWNDREAIDVRWRLTAGRDIIGANLAAVPASQPDGCQVLSASVNGDLVDLELGAGRIWADGLHTILAGETPVARVAAYLPAPHNPAGTSTASIVAGVRDAVVLEVSLAALNGFQDPERLIEPALGGPDTAERLAAHTTLGLLRLGPGEDCTTIGARLRDGNHGRLSVSLQPPTIVPGDCPVVEGGGYSGFEHNFYRIEIAETNGGAAMFKWSMFNGGLVGRGIFHGGADPRVDITANRTAILSSGLTEFYLEALEYDDSRGHWRLVYATPATLNADDQLDLADPPTFGVMPGAGATAFFRLWNGILPTADFTNAATPVELRDGIRLVFDAAGAYRPESYWTFKVRAGEIANPEILIDDRLPEGPLVRRVPLAEITWGAGGEAEEIEDCRRRFRPLANQTLCCTYVIGNGIASFGDFNSLEEAAAHLPPHGGKLCLLPGIHLANLELVNQRGVQIEGCRHRTFLLPRLAHVAEPIISVRGGQDISIAHLDLIAPFGIAIDIAGSEAHPLREVRVLGCRMMALTHAIRVETVEDIRILESQIWLLDHPLASTAISIRAFDGLIEKNRVGVWPFEYKPPGGEDDTEAEPPDPSDPCIEPDDLFTNIDAVLVYVRTVWAASFTPAPTQPYRARGGIHIKGASERIDLRRNRISGGLGHGITLGGVLDSPEDEEDGEGPGPTIIENPQVDVLNGAFFAQVQNADGQRMANFALTLGPAAGAAVAGMTDATGAIRLAAPDGAARLGVEPGHAVSSMVAIAFGSNRIYVITVVEIEDSVNADAGFLTRIRIIENQIAQMGLSGVGFWFYDLVPDAGLVAPALNVAGLAELISMAIAPRELLGTVNIVRDLVIRENRIEGNLQAGFTDLLRQASLFVAQGGLSLGIVEGLRIEDNHIAGNGISAADPCAGIFVGYGEEVQISGNTITGNGPVADRYRELRSEGLRGGIFIRMAASSVAGATDDGIHKPALLIHNNTIDQPAGRAITALAYGPVSVVGNTLNSEWEGAWSVIDTLVGAVLILNLGGIHRLLGAPAVKSQQAKAQALAGNPDSLMAMTTHHAPAGELATRVEALLPGGETLVNSNRVRTGPENRTWSAQLLVTADDLGFDGNQSGTFRPDVTFSNLIAVAHSLRVTDNRFRERARYGFMSALTITGGATLVGGARSMNMTTENQGDHCIVAMSQGAIPVEDSMNQIVVDQLCPLESPGEGQMNKPQYVVAALLLAWRASVQPDFQEEDGEDAVHIGVDKSLFAVEQMQLGVQSRYRAEALRLAVAKGAEDPATREVAAKAARQKDRAAALVVQGEIAKVREAAVPAEGALIDGRVADATGRAVKGQVVELVNARGVSLGMTATTDANGYYALALEPALQARLASSDDVFLRVRDADGQVLSQAPQKIRIGDQALLREDLQIRGTAPLFRLDPNAVRTDVFRNDRVLTGGGARARGGGAGPVTDNPDRPGTTAGPRVELEAISGVAATLAERLRNAGIRDANDLVARPEAEITRVLGRNADRIVLAAREAIRRAGNDD
jgi:hypothetical protein